MTNIIPDKKNILTRIDSENRKKIIGDTNYTLELFIEENSNEYRGEVTIDFKYTQGDVSILKIDFVSKEITNITLNGDTVKDYTRGDYALYLDTGLLVDGSNILTIKYINKYDNTGSGFHKFTDPVDNEIYIHTDFEPYDAHSLFPCFDQPDIKATYQLTITGPDKWIYLHNTQISDQTKDGNNITIKFNRIAKFSTYLFALVIGPYEKWESKYNDIPLGLFCRKSLAKYMDQDNIFDITKEAMGFLEEYFDYPYPYEKYDQVFVPEFNFGAMENVGCITFTERYIFRHKVLYNDHLRRANTIVHEMVHMWFGDLVTMKWWNDLWLKESFADYLSYYALSKGKLFPDSLEHFYAGKEWAYYEDQLSTTHPIAASAIDTDEAFSNFDGISYTKGASVLKQLQYFIGEEKFQKAMQVYFKKFAEENTTLDDFLSLMSEQSGIDIIQWSKQWLETTGVNTLTTKIDDSTIKLTQIGSEGNNLLREHAIEYVGYKVSEGKPVQNEKGKLIIKDKKQSIKLQNKDTQFTLCNDNDYGYLKIHFSEDDISFISDHIDQIDDTFSRRMIWGNLWQMVRDNVMSPMVFLDLVMAKGPKEKDSSILQSHIVSKAIRMMNVYLSDENRKKYLPQLFSLAHNNLENIKHNDEEQIIWFNLLLDSAENDDEIEILYNLLNNKLSFEKLTIDQEKRWSIITRLNAYNYSEADSIIREEKNRDKSDLGLKEAFMAEVSKPDGDSKLKYWEIFIGKQEKSTDFLRYGMSGFNWYCQKNILEPFIDSYFKSIDTIYKERDIHYASAFGSYLFPSWYRNESILKRIEDYLEQYKSKHGEIPLLLEKLLKESRDNLKRTISVISKQLS